LNLYYSLWSAIRIIALGGARSGAIILIALQRVRTILYEFYYTLAFGCSSLIEARFDNFLKVVKSSAHPN